MAARQSRAVALLLLVALAVCSLLRPSNATSLRRQEQSGKKPATARRGIAEAATAAAATTIVPQQDVREQQRDYHEAGQQRNLQDLQPQLSISGASGMELSVFPSVEESTILFLHVFKVNILITEYCFTCHFTISLRSYLVE